MNRFLVLLILFLTTSYANANNIVVESLTDINSKTSSADFSAKVLEQSELSDDISLNENFIINGEIVKIVQAKRGKRNAYIIIKPVSYIDADNNTVKLIKDTDLEAKVVGYSKKDFKQTGLNAGLAVGGHFIKGMGQIFYFSKGLIKPDDGKSRIETAAHNVYENSPFVYIEKGQDINIEKGDYLVLKFYHSNVPKWRPIKRQK